VPIIFAILQLRAGYEEEKRLAVAPPQVVAEMKGMLRRKEGLARGTVSATQTRLVLLQDLMKHPLIGHLFIRPQLARYGS
jgi:hypothetical protein